MARTRSGRITKPGRVEPTQEDEASEAGGSEQGVSETEEASQTSTASSEPSRVIMESEDESVYSSRKRSASRGSRSKSSTSSRSKGRKKWRGQKDMFKGKLAEVKRDDPEKEAAIAYLVAYAEELLERYEAESVKEALIAALPSEVVHSYNPQANKGPRQLMRDLEVGYNTTSMLEAANRRIGKTKIDTGRVSWLRCCLSMAGVAQLTRE